MKRTLITLSLAAQMVAFGAFAQTSGTSDPAAPTATFGSDWSSTLGSAMFGEDRTTVRPATELTAQWATLSDEDKAMIQRDCLMHTQLSGGATDVTGAASDAAGTTGTTEGTATTGTSETTAESTTSTETGTTSTDAEMTISVTADQMEEICAATKDM